jgi:hypothetical protein
MRRPQAMVRTLTQINGLGVETADMLVSEIFFRDLRDRRAIARYAGLTGSPDESGSMRREKGLAKAGNARVRRGMIELAWRFLRFQGRQRFGKVVSRQNRSCAGAAQNYGGGARAKIAHQPLENVADWRNPCRRGVEGGGVDPRPGIDSSERVCCLSDPTGDRSVPWPLNGRRQEWVRRLGARCRCV